MIVENKYPLNIKPEHKENVFDLMLHYEVNEPKVLVIKNPFFNSMGIVWNSEGETTIKECLINQLSEWHPLRILQKKNSVHINEPIILFSNNWELNYYHYWFDSIARLILLEDYKDVTLGVSIRNINLPDKKWVLDVLGFKKRLILNDDIIYQAPLIYFPTFFRSKKNYRETHHKIVVERMREIFLPYIDDSLNMGEKIYVRRVDRLTPQSLKILDEAAERHGFFALNPASYSIKEQISIFSHAKYVLGVHGAGLTNIVWCTEPTLIEVRCEGDYITTHYFDIVNTLNGDYIYIFGKWKQNYMPVRNNFINNSATSIIEIDEKDVEEALEFIYKKENKKPSIIIDNYFSEEKNINKIKQKQNKYKREPIKI